MANKLIILFLFVCSFGYGQCVGCEPLTSFVSKFDTEWTRSVSYYTSQTSGTETSGQRRYYDNRVIDGLIAIFQATGDTKYLDNYFWYVDRIMAIGTLSGGYYDWPVGGVNYQLYDGHGYRNILKMMVVLKNNPSILAMSYDGGTYQDKYDEYVPYWTHNLWDKWVSRGNGNILRSNTHMSSHLSANTALWLYLLEDDSTQKDIYLGWINAFNTDVDSKVNRGGAPGTGFRDQLRIVSGKYIWNGNWGTSTGSNDITHTNAESQALVNLYLQGIEYTSTDMDYLLETLNDIMDDSANGNYSDIPFNLDLTGSRSGVRTFAYGWCMLGRFDETTQQRLEDFNVSTNQSSYYHNMFLGNMAYNRAYLDGTLVYPEFGEGGGGVDPDPGDVTAPVISNVTIENLSETAVRVYFNVNELAKAQIRYGTSTGVYTVTGSLTAPYDYHGYKLGQAPTSDTPLAVATTHYLQIYTEDATGNNSWSSEYNFTTLGGAPPTTAYIFRQATINGNTVSKIYFNGGYIN